MQSEEIWTVRLQKRYIQNQGEKRIRMHIKFMIKEQN